MSFFNRKILFLSTIIIGFTSILIWFDFVIDDKVHSKYKSLTSTYAFQLKKEQITEIIETVYFTAQTALLNGYKIYEQRLASKAKQTKQSLLQTDNSTWCKKLEKITQNEKGLFFKLYSKDTLMCQKNFQNQEKFLSSDKLKKDILVKVTLADGHTLEMAYTKEVVHDFIKNRIAKLIRSMKFKNPDIYVWVNEVYNYEGGDGYAIRRVHPNLVHTEGMQLSTNTKDIKGNLPYLEELEGVKKDGEVYLEYYFKKKTSEGIHHKLSYAKLFKPFDWIIATGIYLDDIEEIIAKESQNLTKELEFHHNILIFVSIMLSSFLILLLYKKEKSDIESKEDEIKLIHKQEEVENYQQVLYSMLDLVEKRDTYTAGHTQRVARYAVLIAEAMDFDQDEIDMLYEAAIMHDIGKVSTPDAILLKPGRLNENEYKIIQGHLTCGYEILTSIKAFIPHAQIMRNHHERYDGKGYPRGLKGDEIPLLSHILILVDAFDAMTSQRIYKARKEIDVALKEIEELKGKQFSPIVVDAALPVLKKVGVLTAEHNYLSDELEEARVAYYYKDPLTGLYNYHYLEHILFFAKHIQAKHYQCCYFINTTNFNNYNKEYGWIQGDKKLYELAKNLSTTLPDATIFRIYGDDFLILHEKHYDIDAKELKESLKLGDILDISLFHLDLNTLHVKSFSELSDVIFKFIKSAKEKYKNKE